MPPDEEGNPEHVEGVNFTDINPALEDVTYPVTVEEFVSEHGDREIERTSAEPITIRELFEPMGEDTYEDDEEVRQAILTLMPKDSEGRQRYSDRGLTIDDLGGSDRQDRPLPGHDEEPD